MNPACSCFGSWLRNTTSESRLKLGAWGIHTNRWQQVRDVLNLVGFPKVQYYQDTFPIAAAEAGDTSNSDAPVRSDGLARLDQSLAEIRRTITTGEIGYLQLSDAVAADQRVLA